MYLLLDIDGGLWIVSQSLEFDGPKSDHYKEATAYHWRLGQSTKADFSPRYDNSIGKWIDKGVASESSIPGHLGKLVDQLGITI
jgi:hypothetical protein